MYIRRIKGELQNVCYKKKGDTGSTTWTEFILLNLQKNQIKWKDKENAISWGRAKAHKSGHVSTNGSQIELRWDGWDGA